MRNPGNLKTKNRGFVLITGLIFLVVITLLALSTMGSTTLQEKMASNLREQSRALEAADAGLRDGEARLVMDEFSEYQPADETYCYAPTDPAAPLHPAPDGTCENGSLRWYLWRQNQPLAKAKAGEGFLDPGAWGLASDGSPLAENGDPRPSSYSPPFDASLSASPRLYIEEFKFQGSLQPDEAATGQNSTVIYRITARAQGGRPSAVAVTQSQYLKRY